MVMQVQNVTVVPEGDGVNVKRLFPLPGFMNFDPFVLWDHFDIGPGRGFPDHPHRGFEAITYMFAGGMNHKDNMGNESFVTPGGAQRFTAGSGLIHSEIPAKEGNSSGIQLWINLPKRLKQLQPSYQQVNDTEFPVQTFKGTTIKTIVGEGSPLTLNTDVIYRHIKLVKNAEYQFDVSNNYRGIIYLTNGNIAVNNKIVAADQALFTEQQTNLLLKAHIDSDFMICFGKPHNEPIHQHGPFVD